MEKHPEINGNGEMTFNIRKQDRMKIPTTPAKYKAEYVEDSIQPNANLPA